MPDNVGGQPFQDGEEPEYRQGGDDELCSVVLDEDFVRSAEVHEPSAAERAAGAPRTREESDEEDDEGRFDRSDYGGYVDLSGLEGPDGPEKPDDPGGRGGHRDLPGPGDAGTGLRSGYAPRGGRPYPPGVGSASRRRDTCGLPPFPDTEPEHGSDHGYGRPPGSAAWRAHPYGGFHDGRAPYRGQVRWQRPVAWILAVVMGIGIAALAVSAVSHGSGSDAEESAPVPTTSGVDVTGGPEQGAPAADGGAALQASGG